MKGIKERGETITGHSIGDEMGLANATMLQLMSTAKKIILLWAYRELQVTKNCLADNPPRKF